jgi:putative ABC transport system permease protein
MRLGDWIMELQHSARTLLRTPVFTLTTVLMLGLSIGATAGMFSVVDAVLLRPLPYPEPERLVHIAATAPGSPLTGEFGVSAEFVLQYREQSKRLENLSTYNSFTNTLRANDRVERVRMTMPTNTLFATLGVTPILGRLPTDADEDRTILISHALWVSWFGRDPGVIGRVVQAGGAARTIIGVMGEDFRFPTDDTMLWIPRTLTPADVTRIGNFGINLVGRMAPGATTETTANELTTLAARLPQRFGGTATYARVIAQHRAVVRSFDTELLGAVARPLWVLLAAAAIVLLIACANVGNLFLVRAEGRHREIATRRALGATRGQLVRLQMTEALVIAAFAGALALALAAVILPVFVGVAPPGVPRLGDVALDANTVAFTLAISLLSALICGGLPALRGAAVDLTRLRDGGRGTTRRGHRLRHALVIGQTALALVLLIGSGLLVRSAYAMRQVHPGYDPRDVFTFQIAPERPELDDAAAYARFDLAFIEQLKTLRGVESVGLIENVPINEGTSTMRLRTEETRGDADAGALLNFTYTAGDYFRTMGITVLGGRTFTDDDHRNALGNVLVSKSAAEILWPGRDPIGRRLQREGSSEWETVVGVVGDVMQDGLRDAPQAVVYFPLVAPIAGGGQPITSPAYVLKTARAETIAPEVRALVRKVAPEAPMYRVYTMAGLVAESMAPLSFTLMTLGIAAGLSLLLGGIGLYGVLSYIVAERSREIGVRMALGARADQVQGMVVKQGARVVAIGVATGLVAAFVCTRSLDSLLYGVQPVDIATFAVMSLAMAAIGLLASYLPARRASHLDPVESLRRD